MCSNDAAKSSFSTVHQEEGEECLFATKPWNHQGAEKREKSRTRNFERADYYAHLANAVRLFAFFFFPLPTDMVLIHLLQTADAGFHCPAAANYDSDASRTRATSTGGGGAQGETTTTTGPPARDHSTRSSTTCSLTRFQSRISSQLPFRLRHL